VREREREREGEGETERVTERVTHRERERERESERPHSAANHVALWRGGAVNKCVLLRLERASMKSPPLRIASQVDISSNTLRTALHVNDHFLKVILVIEEFAALVLPRV